MTGKRALFKWDGVCLVGHKNIIFVEQSIEKLPLYVKVSSDA